MFFPRTVLLPDGESELALRVLRCLSRVPELSVYALSQEQWCPIRFSRHLSGFRSHSVRDFNHERLAAIKAAAAAFGAEIILPVEIPTMKLLADHQEELRQIASVPPSSPSELFDLVSDKWRLSEILAAIGIQHPKTILLQEGEAVAERLKELRFPILAKPRRASGGSGIQQFDSHKEALHFFSSHRDRSTFVAQEFVRGELFDCNILSHSGEILACTVQRALVPGKTPFKPPSGIEFVHNDRVRGVIERLLRALDWSGVANFDLVVDLERDEIVVLEMNARYWRSLLGSLAAGVNFPALACLLSEGIPFSKPTYQKVRYVKPESSPRLLLRRYLGLESPISSLRETGLPFVLRDPIPELAIVLCRSSNSGSAPC